MPYPDLIANSRNIDLLMKQDEMYEEYRRMHQEEMRAAGEGTSGPHDKKATQPDQHARVPRGFSYIVVEGMR